MNRRLTRRGLLAGAVTVLTGAAVAGAYRRLQGPDSIWAKGDEIGELDGVLVYDNGPIFIAAHGRHYADDGYYFGQKWQCVEFIKRYLYSAKSHRMPEMMGHAISFYDPDIAHGALNPARAMTQFTHGGVEPPRAGDLLVFGGAGGYGHVAIVADVQLDFRAGFLEVVQQNKAPVRQRLALKRRAGGGYELPDSSLPPLGWLRA